jgi:hypothetical protein
LPSPKLDAAIDEETRLCDIATVGTSSEEKNEQQLRDELVRNVATRLTQCFQDKYRTWIRENFGTPASVKAEAYLAHEEEYERVASFLEEAKAEIAADTANTASVKADAAAMAMPLRCEFPGPTEEAALAETEKKMRGYYGSQNGIFPFSPVQCDSPHAALVCACSFMRAALPLS